MKIITTLLGFCLLVSMSGCTTMSNLTDKITGNDYRVRQEFFGGSIVYGAKIDADRVMEDAKTLQKKSLPAPPTEEQVYILYYKADIDRDNEITLKEANYFHKDYSQKVSRKVKEKVGDDY